MVGTACGRGTAVALPPPPRRRGAWGKSLMIIQPSTTTLKIVTPRPGRCPVIELDQSGGANSIAILDTGSIECRSPRPREAAKSTQAIIIDGGGWRSSLTQRVEWLQESTRHQPPWKRTAWNATALVTSAAEFADECVWRDDPIELPIGAEKSLTGVVDLVRMKAYTYELGGNGKGKETEIPANMRAQVQGFSTRC